MLIRRRKFLKTLAGLGGIGLFTGLYAWQIEPFWLEFVEAQMPLKNLPASLNGLKLMQISDIHIGNRFDPQFIVDSFEKASTFHPDFVVYTGDFVSYDSPEQLKQLESVFDHAVKGRIGTLAILGNHDYGRKWAENEVAEQICEIITSKGIRMLRNESIEINGLHITGLDDYWGTNYHPESVLKNINPANANLVLCHNPDVVDEPVWNGYQGWILSGHTHGGQCKPPFLPAPVLPVKNKKYSAGKIDLEDGRTLYINRALGHLWQIRFNVRPEITIFNLVSS